MQTIIAGPDANPVESYLTAADVAARLGVTPRWVIEKARSGDLPCVKLPGSNRVRFLMSAVEAEMRREQGG